MDKIHYRTGNHCCYRIMYHIVWCPKFRFFVLNDDIACSLKRILSAICKKCNYMIHAVEVMPDHIHLLIDCPQTEAPCAVVRKIKSLSAVYLFKKYPKLRRFYCKSGHLWSAGYFISTVGQTDISVVENYIRYQKTR